MSAARVAAIREAMPGRIAKGSALLTSTDPMWPEHVDILDLEIDSCRSCVLGQLYSDYDEGIAALFGIGEDPYQDRGKHVEHGFLVERWDMDYDEREQLVTEATIAWVAEIRRLRGED